MDDVNDADKRRGAEGDGRGTAEDLDPLDVLEAFVAGGTALAIFGYFAAKQQQAYSPIMRDAPMGVRVDWARMGIVAFILVVAIVANVVANLRFPAVLDRFPVIGAAVWVAILVTAPIRRPHWALMPATFRGTIFLLALVTTAAMMPVEQLPAASWQTTLGLGFLSAVFDNIPLTALALHQGGYDWGFLAYAVGFGGSMIWFGSSAGAYVVGFFVLLAVLGWHPHAQRTKQAIPAVSSLAPSQYQLSIAFAPGRD